MSKARRKSGMYNMNSICGYEEIDVYDQCCDNCRNNHCPMRDHDSYMMQLPPSERKRIRKAQKQDSIRKKGVLNWCIYWRGEDLSPNTRDDDNDYILRDFDDGDLDGSLDDEVAGIDQPSYCEYFDE